MKVMLALEDGMVFEGESFGSTGERYGEVVFNTSMTGYQEILTDPSYKGQIVTMTYPLIGNYGCNYEDFESTRPYVEGFVVREYSSYWSNWRAKKSLDDFLSSYDIIGIQGVDTRALTRRLRTRGVMKGVISTEDLDKENLIAKAKASPGLVGLDLVKYVMCNEVYQWEGNGGRRNVGTGKAQASEKDMRHEARDMRNGAGSFASSLQSQVSGLKSQVFLHQPEFDFTRRKLASHMEPSPFRVVAVDSGIKHNILRMLQSHSCKVTVVPATASAEEIMAFQPEGIFLSNGPGDPEGVPYLVETVRNLIGKKPIFGICLGHQILGLAFGGKSFKLKFGHRGANQPVKNLITGKVEITTQNHGFCIDIDSLKGRHARVTHINLNDNTLEGMEHEDYPIFSVQYHPEASPGPHDAGYLFDRFVNLMQEERS